MKRLIAVCVAFSTLAHPLWAKDPALDWQSAAIRSFAKYQKSGSDAFILSLEEQLQQKLTKNDASYLRSKLGQAYKNSRAQKLELKQSQDRLVIAWEKNAQTVLSLENEKELQVKLDGKLLDLAPSDSIEDVSKKVWALLAPQHGWGSYPDDKKTSSFFWINLLLPQAHADSGTVIAIAIAVAVIGAIAYLTYKTGKSIDKAGDAAASSATKIGDSAAKGINKISNSAAKTLDAATETLNTANDTLKETQKDLEDIRNDVKNINEIKINGQGVDLPTEH